ncbi:hypothetical protein U1Q18_045785, partial [Sarracenia purpurea var. burkii]
DLSSHSKKNTAVPNPKISQIKGKSEKIDEGPGTRSSKRVRKNKPFRTWGVLRQAPDIKVNSTVPNAILDSDVGSIPVT